MLSIEGAWAELAWEEAECFHERSGATDRDHVATKARTLCLAVLEEAKTYDAKHNHKDVRPGCCVYHGLRTRIEALGREGDDGTGVDEKTG